MNTPFPIRYRRGRRQGESGFALLEILVAFLILALGLAAIFVGVGVATRSDAKTQASRNALRVAQSRLEAAGVTEGLVAGRREGRIGNRYDWQQTVTLVQIGARDTAGPRADAKIAATFWVEVSVRTGDGAGARLAGLKLAAPVKP